MRDCGVPAKPIRNQSRGFRPAICNQVQIAGRLTAARRKDCRLSCGAHVLLARHLLFRYPQTRQFGRALAGKPPSAACVAGPAALTTSAACLAAAIASAALPASAAAAFAVAILAVASFDAVASRRDKENFARGSTTARSRRVEWWPCRRRAAASRCTARCTAGCSVTGCRLGRWGRAGHRCGLALAPASGAGAAPGGLGPSFHGGARAPAELLAGVRCSDARQPGPQALRLLPARQRSDGPRTVLPVHALAATCSLTTQTWHRGKTRGCLHRRLYDQG